MVIFHLIRTDSNFEEMNADIRNIFSLKHFCVDENNVKFKQLSIFMCLKQKKVKKRPIFPLPIYTTSNVDFLS